MPDGTKDVSWYGVDMQLHHDCQEDLSVGIRSEWFRDKDGFQCLLSSPGRSSDR